MPDDLPDYLTDTVEQTEDAAAALARSLRGGECVALHGEMGAGKTQFVRGLVRGLGGNPRAVSSPTFVLLNVYAAPPIRLPVYHLDAYRVSGSDDFDAIGFTELLGQGGVVVVEWPGRVLSLLPENRIDIHITAMAETTRRIEIHRPPDSVV